MRLEAEKMDWELTKQKLQTMQDKVEKLRIKQTRGLADPAKLSEALETMERQAEQLRQKLGKKDDDDLSAETVPKKTDDPNGTAIHKSASTTMSTSTTSASRYREAVALEVALEASIEPAQTATAVLEKPDISSPTMVEHGTGRTDDNDDADRWNVSA